MKKEFLGLRNSLWIILLLLTLILVPFIILSFFSSVSLRIPGFVLVGIGSAAIVLYFILNMIVTRERKTRKNQAILFIKGLKEKVSVYSLEKPSSKICWNCFYEIKKNEIKCPKCKDIFVTESDGTLPILLNCETCGAKGIIRELPPPPEESGEPKDEMSEGSKKGDAEKDAVEEEDEEELVKRKPIIKCPQCSEIFPVDAEEGEIECPNCGMKGSI